jgi:hypothetical protein
VCRFLQYLHIHVLKSHLENILYLHLCSNVRMYIAGLHWSLICWTVGWSRIMHRARLIIIWEVWYLFIVFDWCKEVSYIVTQNKMQAILRLIIAVTISNIVKSFINNNIFKHSSNIMLATTTNQQPSSTSAEKVRLYLLLHVWEYTYIRMCIYTQLCTNVYIYMYIHIYVYAYVYIYIYMFIHTYVYFCILNLWKLIFIHICAYI